MFGVISNYKSRIPAAAIFVAALGIIAGGCFGPAQAEDKSAEVCQFYQDKLREAEKNCDLEKILSIWELSQQLGYDCVNKEVSRIIVAYSSKCLGEKSERASSDCNINLILREETLVNTRLKDQPGYAIMREMLKRAKCINFVDKCLDNMLKEAIAQDDWPAIIEVEETINSDAFKNCYNLSKLAELIKRAKHDYFKQWIPKKLGQAVEKGDLGEIYRLEAFVSKDMQNSPDFEDIQEEFLKIKCQKLDVILNRALEEAVANCNANQILDVENLLLYKWKKNCLGYDYAAMEARIMQAERSYLEGCLNSELKTCVNRCDLGRIVELEKMTGSLQAVQAQQEVAAKKCNDLTECLEADLGRLSRFAIKSVFRK